MKTSILATLSSALLLLVGCGGSSTGNTPPSAQSPSTTNAPVFIAGVLEQGATGLTWNQRPLDTRSAQVTMNGEAVAADALRPGMPISGTAQARGQDLILEKAEVHTAIEGPLEAVDHDTLKVLGRSVLLTRNTVLADDQGGGRFGDLHLEDLHPRDGLVVFGVASSGAQIEATRIERHGGGLENRVDVRGALQGLDLAGSRFQLNGTLVNFGMAQVVGTLAESAPVEVQGVLAGGVITASRVKVEDPAADVPQGEAELRGSISLLDPAAKTFRLLAFTIDFSGAAVSGTLVNGGWVQVHAVHGAGQALDQLTATTVKVEDPALPAVGEEMSGILMSVDPAAKVISLGSMSFWFDDSTALQAEGMPLALSSLQSGAQVEIHFDPARSNAAGLAYAFRIQVEDSPEPAGTESKAEGSIAAFDPASMSLSLGGVTVKAGPATTYHRKQGADLTAAEFWSANRNGAKAEAQGTVSGTTLTARRIELK